MLPDPVRYPAWLSRDGNVDDRRERSPAGVQRDRACYSALPGSCRWLFRNSSSSWTISSELGTSVSGSFAAS